MLKELRAQKEIQRRKRHTEPSIESRIVVIHKSPIIQDLIAR